MLLASKPFLLFWGDANLDGGSDDSDGYNRAGNGQADFFPARILGGASEAEQPR
jgi:hypothetical protein